MGNKDISVELASLKQAVSSMDSQLVTEINELSGDWHRYVGRIEQSAWSSEEACLAFGTTYVSAIQAYDEVMQGMKQDIKRYRDELQATYDAYINRDDSVMGEMNQRLAKLDDISAADDKGRTAYKQRTNLDDGTDTPPARPADTSPGE